MFGWGQMAMIELSHDALFVTDGVILAMQRAGPPGG
jgi:hypothetical protein